MSRVRVSQLLHGLCEKGFLEPGPLVGKKRMFVISEEWRGPIWRMIDSFGGTRESAMNKLSDQKKKVQLLESSWVKKTPKKNGFLGVFDP